ncbi:tripartite ATP-independent transporter DctP family solute receptor [Hoeflea marina]|uniref:Tripartite ATP-independent transporter DctP family solute receptor n=1 Tax=Hoeflea marina TaxID=274592 RepID=A0A317PKC7_9HYPH|nr:sialic acid TRAP transporter substrate-binding protein SiaP [Hoeflea marina]PWW00326.1 tripartite ATP-independent transporter DctP family solute receptor [Hoeflea marina]
MTINLTRRALLAGTTALLLATTMAWTPALAENVTLRLSSPASATDQRAVALTEVFGPQIKDFATFEPHWNAELFKQGTELEAIARGNLDMAITSAQELATLIPEFSIFTAGYLHRDAEHQKKVFAADFMEPLKQKVEETLGVKLLSVMYLGRRQLNLRTDNEVKTPADLAGLKLRMPGTDAWQFLGKALGASPVPVAFTEVYTALQTGAIDGQDNPLPTDKDAKFYEVTKQIVLTSHLVDLNYLAMSKKVFDSLTPDQQAALQKASDDAAESGRQKQLALEAELEQFFKDQGLKVYTPDLEAFRTTVQKAYLESEFSKSWPEGMVDKINAL